MADPYLAQPGAVPHHAIWGASGVIATRPDTEAEATAKRDEKPDETWAYWMKTIQAALAIEKTWRQEGEDAERRYFGDSSAPENRATLMAGGLGGETNVAHSTIDTMKPVFYSQPPDPIVRRRFQGDGEDDPVDRIVAEVAQRVLQYLIDSTEFDSCMETARDDWLLPGRGWARVVYKAEVEQAQNADTGESETRIVSEQTYTRYWPWRDVVMSPAPTWMDVRWIAYRHFMAREDAQKHLPAEVVEQLAFHVEGVQGEDNTDGALGTDVSSSSEDDAQKGRPTMGDVRPRAVVWEIWLKEGRQVLWLAEGYSKGLAHVEPDPYGFKDFWDCPKPLVATARGQTSVPRPDMAYYIKQLDAIDLASRRLNSLLAQIKVRGAYPGNHDALVSKLLDEDGHGLVAVKDWTAFLQKGGKDFIHWLPLDQWANAATLLRAELERKKQELFEISGVSDAMRGQGDPNRTATQDRIQGRYTGLKVSSKQRRMANFVRDTLRLMLEMAVEQYDEATIAAITNIDLPWTEQEREIRSTMVPGPDGVMAPADPTFTDRGASWETVMARLRDDLMRSYSVSIETDSTILEDEVEDREARIAFLKTFQEFVAGMAPLVASIPDSWPITKGFLLFGVRGFRKARMLEHLIEDLPDKIEAPQEGESGPSKEEVQLMIAQMKGELEREIEAEKQRHETEESAKDRAHELRKIGVEMKGQAIKLEADVSKADRDRSERRSERHENLAADRERGAAEFADRAASRAAASEGNMQKVHNSSGGGEIEALAAEVRKLAEGQAAIVAALNQMMVAR